VIEGIWEEVHRFYTKTRHFIEGTWASLDFGILGWEGLGSETSLPRIPRDNCVIWESLTITDAELWLQKFGLSWSELGDFL
jgi:hypothetical protein